MQKPICLALALLCFAAMPALAQSSGSGQAAPNTGVTVMPDDDDNATGSDQPGASAADGNSGQQGAPSAAPPPPSKSSLMDLKNTQDKADQAGEVNPSH